MNRVTGLAGAVSINAAMKYALLGAGFGCLFPLGAMVLRSLQDSGTVNGSAMWAAQRGDVLLWIIDTAPFFLGLFAAVAGAKQDRITRINLSLADKVEQQTRDLRLANESLKVEIKAKQDREHELVTAYRRAEAGKRAKDRFLSGISHELRTPMNGIIGLTELLLDAEQPVDHRRSLESVAFSARHLLVIIEDLLDIAQAEARELKLDLVTFSMADVLRVTEDAVRPEVERKGIGFEVSLRGDDGLTLQGDPVRLRQVLLNLVHRSARFTEHGGIRLEIRMRPPNGGARDVAFELSDSGPPLSVDWSDRVFDHDVQVRGGDLDRPGGVGLALSIARKLVELQGGELTHAWREGCGNCFRFSLRFPVCDEVAVSGSSGPRPRFRSTLSAELRASTRVLLVEDNPINQKVATALLDRLGVRWDLANNGVEALTLVEQRVYDLILMDIHMPEMDGLETTRRIRAATDPILRETRIVAVTASVQSSEVERCYAAGVNDFIAKPYHPNELCQKVTLWLRHVSADSSAIGS